MAESWQSQVEAATADVDFSSYHYSVRLDTTKGPILLDLFPDVAPGHCRNFIGLARSGFYNGVIFHRIVGGFVIQAGCPYGNGTGGPGYQIEAEFNDRPHEPGTLSMARRQDPNSAGSQFFLCLSRIPHLDGKYTVFGHTADSESLQVVREIGRLPTDENDRPLTEVRIESATVLVRPKKRE